jgi:hypothetical protein
MRTVQETLPLERHGLTVEAHDIGALIAILRRPRRRVTLSRV